MGAQEQAALQTAVDDHEIAMRVVEALQLQYAADPESAEAHIAISEGQAEVLRCWRVRQAATVAVG